MSNGETLTLSKLAVNLIGVILLALGLLHVCHHGKPLCWLDWLEGTQTQSCVRGDRIPPLSFILFLSVVLVSVLRLLEPLARQPAWVDDREDEDG